MDALDTPVHLQLDTHAATAFLSALCRHVATASSARWACVIQPRTMGAEAFDVTACGGPESPGTAIFTTVVETASLAELSASPSPLGVCALLPALEDGPGMAAVALQDGQPFAVLFAAGADPDVAERVIAEAVSRIQLELVATRRSRVINERNRDLVTAFRYAPVAMGMVDADGLRLVDASEGLMTLLERERGELIGQCCDELPWFDDELIAAIRAAAKDCRASDGLEIRFRDSEDRMRTGLVSTRPTRVADRPHVLVSITDITAYAATLDRLREEEDRYRALFQAGGDMIFLYRLSQEAGGNPGRFIQVNDVACETLGYSMDELARMSTEDLVADDQKERIRDVRDHLLKDGSMLFEAVLITADGSELEVETNAHLFRLRGEQVVLAVSRDISERRRADQAARMLVEAMDASVDGIAIFDQHLRYTYVNEAHRVMNDYADASELIGKDWKTLVSEDDHERLEKEILPEIERSGRWRGGLHAIQMDGRRFAQEASLSRLQDGRIIAVLRDVSEREEAERRLRAAEEQYRGIFENAADGLYRTSPDGRILSANPALAELLGYQDPAELVGTEAKLAARAYREPAKRADLIRQLEEKDEYQGVEFALRRANGEEIWVSDTARVVRDEKGRVAFYEGVLQDITGRRAAEAALGQSEEKYRTLVDTSQDGVFIAQRGIYRYVNHAYAAMLDYTVEEMEGEPVERFIAPEDMETFREYARAGEQPMALRRAYEIRLLAKDGERRITASISAGTILFEDDTATTGTVRDITEQKKAQEQLVHNAMHDALTELPNRGMFLDRLHNAMLRAARKPRPAFAVLFLDLDRFKLINDSLGHEFGDRFLVTISERLKKTLRPSDIIARHGGDEFTILVDEIEGLSGALHVVERIQKELVRPALISGHEVYTSASIGIVLDSADYEHADDLLRDADTAMYRAKAEGKAGYAVFDQEMHQKAKEHLKLETDLRRALERDEFRILYQPIVQISDQRTTSFEALLRWEHPERGVLSPAEFLPAAEESGLILPIGWWVLEEAARQLESWQSETENASAIGVSVNIAQRQFAHWDLQQRIQDLIETLGLKPRLLKLEITENVFMENPEDGVRILRGLKSLGVSLQMDDFGTGYSSLAGIRNLPLDTLKIDRSFVSDIEQDPGDLAIVRTIAQLADDLSMDIVAEGVETARQHEMLAEIGCSHGQGFHYARPMKAEQVLPFLRDRGDI